MERGNWLVTVHSVTKSDITEHLSTYTVKRSFWLLFMILITDNYHPWASLVAQMVKNSPAMQETHV